MDAEGVRAGISALLLDDRTIPFLLGMGLEATGIAVQMMIGYPLFPVLDVLTVGIVVILLAWYQNSKRSPDVHTDAA